MQWLDSYGNRLETFLQGIEQLQKLEELNLSKNQFLSLEKERIRKLLPKCQVYFK
ncbi:hypothetical protein [Leptospira interrogans]|uniref:hypothetical protein n=1 Tax=Leptospira interrogans TaxID=173 RepID=UPI0012B5482A|nr:hypothetical protein [Leptospira interrogans]